MFRVRRPSRADIEQFRLQSLNLPLSYTDVGIAAHTPAGYDVDEKVTRIGRGDAVFEQAKVALTSWRHFALNWVELFPHAAPIEVGTVVTVVVHHLGFWSLNSCRVVYGLGDRARGDRFGFAYGTLTNHAEMGEEVFEVAIDSDSGDVTYRIRAVSKPHALLARAGYPIARLVQARFRRDSGLAMQCAARTAS